MRHFHPCTLHSLRSAQWPANTSLRKVPRHNRRFNPHNRSQRLTPHPPDSLPRRTRLSSVMYVPLSSTHVAPPIHSPCRFATRNPGILMERRPIPIAARHVLPRFRTRRRQAATLQREEKAASLLLVPKPTCVTYVAFCVSVDLRIGDDKILRSIVTSSPSTMMGRRLILSVASLARSKQRLQES